MVSRVRTRAFLIAVVTVSFANLSVEQAANGAEAQADPRLLLKSSAHRLAESILDMADHYRLASRNDESLALLETGIKICVDTEAADRCRARILNGRGRTLTAARRYEEATDSLEESRDLAAEAGDELTRAAALNALGNNLLRQEDFDVERVGEQLIALHEEALSIYRRLAEEANDEELNAVWSGLGESLFQLAFLDESQGRVEQAEERYRECAGAAERGSNQIILGFCIRHLGYLSLAAGEIDAAEALFRRSLEARRAGGSVAGTGFAMNTLGDFLYQQRADATGALGVLEEGLALMESADEPAGMAAILLTMAKIYNEEGRTDEAREYARRCLEVARAHQVTFVVEEAEQILGAEPKSSNPDGPVVE